MYQCHDVIQMLDWVMYSNNSMTRTHRCCLHTGACTVLALHEVLASDLLTSGNDQTIRVGLMDDPGLH